MNELFSSAFSFRTRGVWRENDTNQKEVRTSKYIYKALLEYGCSTNLIRINYHNIKLLRCSRWRLVWNVESKNKMSCSPWQLMETEGKGFFTELPLILIYYRSFSCQILCCHGQPLHTGTGKKAKEIELWQSSCGFCSFHPCVVLGNWSRLNLKSGGKGSSSAGEEGSACGICSQVRNDAVFFFISAESHVTKERHGHFLTTLSCIKPISRPKHFTISVCSVQDLSLNLFSFFCCFFFEVWQCFSTRLRGKGVRNAVYQQLEELKWKHLFCIIRAFTKVVYMKQ